MFFESGHGNRLLDNTIARNHIGIHASDSSDGNEFAGNRFIGNLHTVETTGGNLTSRWAIDGRGNYWDGAVTLDLDRDGIADLPHRELDLFGKLRRDFPVIGLLAGSPGERLLRFVHARIALARPARRHRSRAARPAHTAMITINGLSKSYGRQRVLDALDLDARPGEVTLLVGANGSGKTTTLRQLCGLSSPDAGRIVHR